MFDIWYVLTLGTLWCNATRTPKTSKTRQQGQGCESRRGPSAMFFEYIYIYIYGDCIIEFDKIFLSPHFCDGVFCPLWLFELPPLTAKRDSAKAITAKPSKTEPLWRGAVCSWLQIVARTKRTADWPGRARVDNLQKTAMMASTHWYTASWLISGDVIVIKLSWNVMECFVDMTFGFHCLQEIKHMICFVAGQDQGDAQRKGVESFP